MARRKKLKFFQGKYALKNPHKYMGNPLAVIFRSSWELRIFEILDESKNVTRWASEYYKVPYWDSIKGKMRVYFTDIYVDFNNNGKKTSFIWEIKPLYKLGKEQKNSYAAKETINIFEKAEATIHFINKMNAFREVPVVFAFVTIDLNGSFKMIRYKGVNKQKKSLVKNTLSLKKVL